MQVREDWMHTHTCGRLHTLQTNLRVQNANMSSYSSSCYSNNWLFCFCQQQMGAFSRGNSSLMKSESMTALILCFTSSLTSLPLSSFFYYLLSIAPYLLRYKVWIADKWIRLSDRIRVYMHTYMYDRLTCAFCRHPTSTPAAPSFSQTSLSIYFFSLFHPVFTCLSPLSAPVGVRI